MVSVASRALELAQEHQLLVALFVEENQLLQETVTLFELELAMAEAAHQHSASLTASGDVDGAALWLGIVAPIMERLIQRQPEDERVTALQQQIDELAASMN